MRKVLLLFTIVLMLSPYSIKAQTANSYLVSNHHDFDKLIFSLNATNGQCIITSGQKDEILYFYNNFTSNTVPSIVETIIDRAKVLNVNLREENNNYLSSTISNHLINFTSPNPIDHAWNISISKLKPVILNLNYVIGDSYIDLSGLSVERLKVKTGNANIVVNYNDDVANNIIMDTFLIKVDMGSFEAKNIHLSRSKNIIADIGFGNVKIDFGNAEFINTNVWAIIGAGKLEIILPPNKIPIKININDSPLCHIELPKDFVKSNDQIFQSPDFDKNQENIINFNIDVAVGNIVFMTSGL